MGRVYELPPSPLIPRWLKRDVLRESGLRFEESIGWSESDDSEYDDLIPLFERWAEAFSGTPPVVQNAFVWALIGNPLFIGWTFRGDEVSLEWKLEALTAMRHVTLAVPLLHGPDEPMENGYYMWWDCVCESIQDPSVADRAFAVLTELSSHEDHRVVVAALHGLGHLNHPDRSRFFDRWIENDPDAQTNPAYRRWLEECRDGTVM